MNDIPKVKDGDWVEMDASIAGDSFSWGPGQVLRVGTDIDEFTAQAFVTPHDGNEPRAHVISEARALERLGHDEELDPMRSEAPPAERADADGEDGDGDGPDEDEGEDGGPDEAGEDGDGEEDDVGEQRDEEQGEEQGSGEQEGETATSPQAEKRETATVKRGRRRVTPPADKPEPEKS